MIEFDGKKFNSIEQALLELAFCHYPVRITIDGKEYIFEEFSKLEELLKSMDK